MLRSMGKLRAFKSMSAICKLDSPSYNRPDM